MQPWYRRASMILIVLAGSMLLLGGCKTTNPQATRAVKSVAATRDELKEGSTKATATVATLQDLSKPNADLPALYKRLNQQITEAEAQAASAGERADDMRTRAAEYIKTWQAENEKLRDPALKAAADARAQKISDRYNDYALQAVEARKAYQPFIQGLKGIRNYLANDLTPGGVAQAKPTIQKAIDDGNTLNQKIIALVNELNSISAEMTPTGAPK